MNLDNSVNLHNLPKPILGCIMRETLPHLTPVAKLGLRIDTINREIQKAKDLRKSIETFVMISQVPRKQKNASFAKATIDMVDKRIDEFSKLHELANDYLNDELLNLMHGDNAQQVITDKYNGLVADIGEENGITAPFFHRFIPDNFKTSEEWQTQFNTAFEKLPTTSGEPRIQLNPFIECIGFPNMFDYIAFLMKKESEVLPNEKVLYISTIAQNQIKMMPAEWQEIFQTNLDRYKYRLLTK